MNDEERKMTISRFIGIHKDLSEVLYQHEQRDFAKETLIYRYDTELGNILSDYTFMMTEINDGINAARNELENNIRESYKIKFENLFRKLKIIKADSSHDLDAFTKRFDTDILDMLSDIKNIENNLILKSKKAENSLSSDFIDSLVEREAQNHQMEIQKQDENFGERVLQMGEESKQRIRKFEAESKSETDKIRKENQLIIEELLQQQKQYQLSMYEVFYKYQYDHEELVQEVEKIKMQHKEMMNALRKQLENIIKDMQVSMSNNKSKEQEAEKAIQEEIKKMKNERESLKKKLFDRKSMLDSEFEMWKNKIKNQLDENEKEFRSKLPKIDEKANESLLNKFMEQLDVKISEEQLVLQNKEKEMMKRYLEKQEKFNKSNYQKEETDLLNTLNDLSKNNDKERKEKAKIYSEKYFKQKEEYDAIIDTFKKNLKMLKDAMNEKEKALLSTINVSKNFDLRDFEKSLEEESENLKQSLNNEFAKSKESTKQLLDKITKECKENEEKEKEKWKLFCSNELTRLKEEFYIVLQNEENKFKLEYDDLLKLLKSIQIQRVPVNQVDDTDEMMKLIDNEKTVQEREKANIILQWNKDIEEENLRFSLAEEKLKNHLTYLDTSLTRTKISNALKLEEMDKTTDDMKLILKDLDDEKYRTVKADIPDVSDLLTKARSESQSDISDAIKNKFNAIKEMKGKLEKLRQDQQKTREDILISQTKQLNAFMIKIKEIKELHKAETDKIQAQIEQLQQERNSSSSTKIEILKEEIERLQKKISEFGKYSRSQIAAKKENLSNRLVETEKRYKEEIKIFESQNITQRQLSSCAVDVAKHKLVSIIKKYESRESREEEIALIERLENQCAQKTQHLMMLSKDGAEYKARLAIQESEVNSRFGVLPSITKSVRKSSNGALPKLIH